MCDLLNILEKIQFQFLYDSLNTAISTNQNPFKQILIYFFISDDEHLSVLEAGGEIQTITVTQRQTAILPCRPTSSSVTVKLGSMQDGMVRS